MVVVKPTLAMSEAVYCWNAGGEIAEALWRKEECPSVMLVMGAEWDGGRMGQNRGQQEACLEVGEGGTQHGWREGGTQHPTNCPGCFPLLCLLTQHHPFLRLAPGKELVQV